VLASFVWIDRAVERKDHEVTKAGDQLHDMTPMTPRLPDPPRNDASMVFTIRTLVLLGVLAALGSRRAAQQLPNFLAQETRRHGARMGETIGMLVKNKFAMGAWQNSLKNKNLFATPADDLTLIERAPGFGSDPRTTDGCCDLFALLAEESLDVRLIKILSDALDERRGTGILRAVAV
jgi:hypothetical protein